MTFPVRSRALKEGMWGPWVTSTLIYASMCAPLARSMHLVHHASSSNAFASPCVRVESTQPGDAGEPHERDPAQGVLGAVGADTAQHADGRLAARLRYAKTEVSAATTVPLSENIGLKLAASMGALVPWGKGWAEQSTCVADRMFVGGPESIRGFRSR